jgi:BirA family biotin operon repressor/biotin-[acetyl-CoA-carboxylase] ligase
MTSETPALPADYRLIRYETLASTNDEAKRLAAAGAADGTVIWAGAQTAGRGRRGRCWVSPPGNLYVSLLLRPDCPVAAAAQLGFVAAVALADAATRLAPGLPVACKWPNDLLCGGRKLAGILLESETSCGERADFVVVGIGVNVVSSPDRVERAATSLAEQGAGGLTPARVLAAFAEAFAAWRETWQAEGFSPVRAAWLARASGLGEAVRVRLERTTLTGRFVDLDEAGALLLQQPAGQLRIAAGEIFPVAG